MRQIEPLESQAPPERVEFTIKQPKAAEIYYSTCGKIDQHNRQRHDTLKLEKKVETNDWLKRVNLSILGMIIVDSYLVYSKLVNGFEKESNYYVWLAEELIENRYSSSVATRLQLDAAGLPLNNKTSPSLFNAHTSQHLIPNQVRYF